MNIGLGDRIRKAREDAGIIQEQLAERIGIAVPTLSKYENGHRTPEADILEKMVQVLKCDPAWLLMGDQFSTEHISEVSYVAETESDYHSYVFVPQVRGAISAGGGLIPDNSVELKIAFRKDWIERRGDPKKMSLIRVSGDSMEPTLQSGDLVLVDLARNYVDPQGGIYAIAFDQTTMIKRIQVLHPSKKIKVISDNTKYDSIETDPDQLIINGKIIWFGREIDR